MLGTAREVPGLQGCLFEDKACTENTLLIGGRSNSCYRWSDRISYWLQSQNISCDSRSCNANARLSNCQGDQWMLVFFHRLPDASMMSKAIESSGCLPIKHTRTCNVHTLPRRGYCRGAAVFLNRKEQVNPTPSTSTRSHALCGTDRAHMWLISPERFAQPAQLSAAELECPANASFPRAARASAS